MVEFVLVSMITGFGPTDGQALSAVLAYRAVNFWLPIPFGGLAYASLEFERKATLQRLRTYAARSRRVRRAGPERRRAANPPVGHPPRPIRRHHDGWVRDADCPDPSSGLGDRPIHGARSPLPRRSSERLGRVAARGADATRTASRRRRSESSASVRE